ncbi:MAG TPA: hypothetical protein VEG27_03305 [Usitatibacter sp.]|nr:hypothetical protein [Usitatibacter sp.]
MGPTARALVVVFALAAVQARAADPDDAALRREIESLKEAVRNLEHRVDVLEGRKRPSVPAASEPPKGSTSSAPTPVPPAAATTTNLSAGPPAAATATAPPAAPSPPAMPAAPVAATTPRAAPLGTDTGYASPEAALRASWSEIGAGMDDGQVTKLLGPPSKKLTLDGRTVWYYYYPAIGNGSVFFTDAGRVSSRQSPFGLGW